MNVSHGKWVHVLMWGSSREIAGDILGLGSREWVVGFVCAGLW